MTRLWRKTVGFSFLLALLFGVYHSAAAQPTVDAAPGEPVVASTSAASVVSDTQAAAAAPAQVVVVVGDTPITLPEFRKQYLLWVFSFQRQLATYQAMEAQSGNQGFFTGQISVTHSLLTPPTALVPLVLSRMKEAAIIGAEAERRNISVTEEDIDAALREEIAASRAATESPGAPGGAATTPAAIDDAAYAADRLAFENTLAATGGLTLADYRQWVGIYLLREHLTEIIGRESISTTEAAVHARHILVQPDGGETDALKVVQELRQRIVNGEDFAAIAAAYSDDSGTAANGGDLGWFGRGMVAPEFEAAAFALQEGVLSEPIKTDFGYHVIEVLARDDQHPRDEAAIEQAKAAAFGKWLLDQFYATAITAPSMPVEELVAAVASVGESDAGDGAATTAAVTALSPAAPSLWDEIGAVLREIVRSLSQAAKQDGPIMAAIKQASIPDEWVAGATLGSPAAPVIMQLWSDSLCPSCQTFAQQVLPQVITEYIAPGLVRLEFHHFPLMQHEPGASVTANAAECAVDEGAFWPFQEQIFALAAADGQPGVEEGKLIQAASALDIDSDRFVDCVATQRQRSSVNSSVGQAQAMGLIFVPAVLVNGELLQLSDFESIKNALDQVIESGGSAVAPESKP